MTDQKEKVAEEEGGYKKNKVDLKLIKKDKTKFIFLAKATTAAYINTLRRYLIERVPSMAIDEVKFVNNTSALYDEMIAHRLGLIVFKTDLKSYFVKEDCKCKGKGCARCQLSMKLDAKGPTTVYAENIKSSDPKIKPIYPKTPIIKLLKDQKIKFEATAILGRGKQHIKYSPGLIYYKGLPIIKVSKCKACKKCVEQCPEKIIKITGKKIKITDPYKCSLCRACEDICPNKAIKIEASKEDYIITIEPWGQLTINEMINQAIEEFNNQLDELDTTIKKIKK